MLMNNFYINLMQNTNLGNHLISKITITCVQYDDTIDDAIYDKIMLMYKNNIPHEILYEVLQNSLDIHGKLNVRKFYDALGIYKNKLGITKEQIKSDIENYDASIKSFNAELIPVVQAVMFLKRQGINEDFIFNEVLKYIVSKDTADLDVEDMRVNAAAIDSIGFMYRAGWSQNDIIDALKNRIDGTPNFDSQKFIRDIPKQLRINERKVSKHDGSIKYVTHLQFLKYRIPVIKFFTEYANDIAELSKKYSDDMDEFAKSFYELYTKYRGWNMYGPKFIISIDENVTRDAGFSPEGFIVLNKITSQERCVNAIIHELMHFEQYLMLINTDGIGLEPYAKELVVQQVAKLTKAFSDDYKERTVLESDFYLELQKHRDILPFFNAALGRFENDFYRGALKIPYNKITEKSSDYKTVQQLADATMTVYDHNNLANKNLVYPKLFTEQMAFSIGNAAAVMFRNIVTSRSNMKNMDNILDFASNTVEK